MVSRIRQDLNIGKNIRKIRINNNLTQEQVVARLQILGVVLSRSIYSQMECGTYNIRVSELIALSEIFNVSINDFFNGLSIH